MKHTRLAAAVVQEIESEGITLSALSARIGRTQGAMSLLIGRGSRVSPETLKSLSHAFRNHGGGVRVMIAHLHDEIERAGWRAAEYHIRHETSHDEKTLSQLDRDLEDMRAVAEHIPAIACLIRDVLSVARAELPEVFQQRGKIKNLVAAEKRADYHADKKGGT